MRVWGHEESQSSVFWQTLKIQSTNFPCSHRNGEDMDNRSTTDDVSFMDMRFPSTGWKLCQEKLPKARKDAYAITLDPERVLLVGGYWRPSGDTTYAQMYNPCKDSWVALKGRPSEPYPSKIVGHAVFKNKVGETMIMIHGWGSPYLHTYNVNTDKWRRLAEVGNNCVASVFVEGIYYTLMVDQKFDPPYVHLSGYDVSLDHPEPLSVEIHYKMNRKERKTRQRWMWMPVLYSKDDDMPPTTLVSLGDKKLAIVWHGFCFQGAEYRRIVVRWTIFEMKKREDGGKLKLVAQALSRVSYHLNSNASYLHGMVPVFPSNNAPEEDILTHSTALNLTIN